MLTFKITEASMGQGYYRDIWEVCIVKRNVMLQWGYMSYL